MMTATTRFLFMMSDGRCFRPALIGGPVRRCNVRKRVLSAEKPSWSLIEIVLSIVVGDLLNGCCLSRKRWTDKKWVLIVRIFDLIGGCAAVNKGCDKQMGINVRNQLTNHDVLYGN